MPTSFFLRQLAERASDPAGRRWIYVPYDQLNGDFGPLSREAPEELGLVLIEARGKPARRPYHVQKLALVLANQRHFALEQAERGVAIEYRFGEAGYAEVLEDCAKTHGPLRMQEAAERELRGELAPLVERGRLEVLSHEGWLTRPEDWERSQKKGPPYRMDAFYRQVRRRTGLLMDERRKPLGGRFSFDGENRKPWPGEPAAPSLPSFAPDEVTAEVCELVRSRYGNHPGRLDPTALPATRADAERLWEWARIHCLPLFGPYEDAMAREETNLFHTRLSALLNLHRLLPGRVIADLMALELPLPSKEGFLRQVLGWREFVRHVHLTTDGMRRLPDVQPPELSAPGDAGWAAYRGHERGPVAAGGDGGAAPSFLGADLPLPPVFWGERSGLECLDRVVESVLGEGYSHHITRLMVVGNLATLLGIDPRQLTDWFWAAYVDAYDWVVEPNVLGMATFAAGPLMTTKPYVSGAAYLDRMSDYCGTCAFHPKKNCPITRWYWAFLARNESKLADNHRLRMPLASLRKRTEEARAEDRRQLASARERLARGEALEP